MTAGAVIPLDTGAVVRSSPPDDRRPIVLLLHGHFGHESDWTAWFDELPAGVAAAAVRAPVPIGERWAWCDFHRDPRIAAWSAAVRGLVDWVDGLPPVPLAAVGWSQGAAAAVHALRRRPARFSAIAMLGGFVVEPRAHAGIARRRPPVWYGIGTDDDVIPPPAVAGARRWLASHTDLEARDYPGVGHRLERSMVTDAMAFVDRRLPGR